MHLRVLGIDPGSRFCGFGVVEEAGGARVRHVQHGVIALEEGAPIEERLAVLHAGLTRALSEHRPAVVAIEDIYYSRNVRSALVLGQARGVALLAAAQSGAVVRSFSSSVIKQAVTGSGRAEKDQVGRMVNALLGITVTERADASDALATAICGLLRAGVPELRRGERAPAATENVARPGVRPGSLRGAVATESVARPRRRAAGAARSARSAGSEARAGAAAELDPARHLARLIAEGKARSAGAGAVRGSPWSALRPRRGKGSG